MEFIKSGIKTVLGAPGGGSNGHSNDPRPGAETVERLIERLQTSTLLEDRRDACRALRSLSKKYRVEVGAQGMDALLSVLTIDRVDSEILAYAIEALLNITSPDILEDEDETQISLGNQFTEIFTKKSENVTVLLSILEEYDFRIRLPLIRLMTNLLTNRPKEIQEVILVSPMGISRLMDLLSDSREVVRNDAILLLCALTKNNSNIQKIMAFENGFDKILQIIQGEGYSDGGPVVEDCLHLFLNLLRNNTSNQVFFREGSYIKRMVEFFNLPDDGDAGWATQKVSNLSQMLQVVRTLVSPLNPIQVTLACQKSMKACGILECLCKILMAGGIPAETLTETIVTVGEVIRGCLENQEHFASVIAPSEPPRPALVIILMTLVNDRQPLSLRCAVLYCVQCFLFKNEKSQGDVVRTLLQTGEANIVTPGQLLCSGLFSKDVTCNWFSSIAFGHTLLDNSAQKENLLKVQLATKAGSPPITLLNHILATLQQTGVKPQVKLGLLQLIAIWLENCPGSITQFLSNPNAIPYLTTQITSADLEGMEALVHGLCSFVIGLCLYYNPNTVPSYTKENLHLLITNRIGLETLTNGLSQISKSEFYLHSLKHPQLLAKHSTDLVFDNTFCILFKKLESLILMHLNNESTIHHSAPDHSQAGDGSNGYRVNRESPNELINRYKEVIRGQDEKIESYKREIVQLTDTNSKNQAKMDEMLAEVLQLKSQLALAQAQRETVSMHNPLIPESQHLTIIAQKDYRIEELQLQVLNLEQRYSGNEMFSSSQKNPMQEELIKRLEEENQALVEEVDKWRKEQDDLLELLAEQENRLSDYANRLKGLGIEVDEVELLDGAIDVEPETGRDSVELIENEPLHHPETQESFPEGTLPASSIFMNSGSDKYIELDLR